MPIAEQDRGQSCLWSANFSCLELNADGTIDYLVAEGWRGLDIRVSLVWKSDLGSEDIERKRGPEQSRRRRLTES